MASSIRRFWSIEDKGAEAKAGWFAAYVMPTAPFAYTLPLMGWALVNRDGQEVIAGMVANTTVREADKPDGDDVFIKYFQRGTFADEQMDQFVKDLVVRGIRERDDAIQRQASSNRRNAESMGERRLLQNGIERTRETLDNTTVRDIQDEEQGGGQGDSTDTP